MLLQKIIFLILIGLISQSCSDTEFGGNNYAVTAKTKIKDPSVSNPDDPSGNPKGHNPNAPFLSEGTSGGTSGGSGSPEGESGVSGDSGTSGASGGISGSSGASGNSGSSGGPSGSSGGPGDSGTTGGLESVTFNLSEVARTSQDVTLQRLLGETEHPKPLQQATKVINIPFTQGIAGETETENLTQTGKKLLDILVVFDISISMSQEAGKLATKLGDLLSKIPSDVDYRVKLVPHQDIMMPATCTTTGTKIECPTSPLALYWAECKGTTNKCTIDGIEVPANIIEDMMKGLSKQTVVSRWDNLPKYGSPTKSQLAAVYDKLLIRGSTPEEGVKTILKEIELFSICGAKSAPLIGESGIRETDINLFNDKLTKMKTLIDHMFYAKVLNNNDSLSGNYANEREFYAAKEALETCGETWLRPRSQLAMLFVSDQDDVSNIIEPKDPLPNGESLDPRLATATTFVDFLKSPFKTTNQNVNYSRSPGSTLKAFAISQKIAFNPNQPPAPGNPANGCNEAGAAASARYIELAAKTGGGTIGSICDVEYGQLLQNISQNIAQAFENKFNLEFTPTPETIFPFQYSNGFPSGSCTAIGNELNCSTTPPLNTLITYNVGRTADYRSFYDLSLNPAPGIIVTSSIGPVGFTVSGKRINFNPIPVDGSQVNIKYYDQNNVLSPSLPGLPTGLDPTKITVPSPYQMTAYDSTSGVLTLTPTPPDGASILVKYMQPNTGTLEPLQFDIPTHLIAPPTWSTTCSQGATYKNTPPYQADCPDAEFKATIHYLPVHDDFVKETGLSNPEAYNWEVKANSSPDPLTETQWERDGSKVIIYGDIYTGAAIDFLITCTPK